MNKRITKEKLKDILAKYPSNKFDSLDDIHPADIVDLLEENEENIKLIKKLPENMIADIIDFAKDDDKVNILKSLPEEKKKKVLNLIASDELTDLIASLNREETSKLLSSMPVQDAKDLRKLLTYAPDTAGGVMATEFISIKDTMSVKETLEYLQLEAPKAESAYYIYVVDDLGILQGVVSLRELVISKFDEKISEIVNKNVISVPFDMDQEEVANIFDKYGLLTIPVVDYKDMLLGIITIDDVIEIIKEETTEDIHRLGGVDGEEKVDSTVKESVKSRLPWLFVNLITAFLASATVGLFEGTISKVVILATFMPIVAGMGGNGGTQTLTIIVRGIALGELTFKNAKRIFFKEIGVGILTGAATGLVTAIVAVLWSGKPAIGIVIGLAMILNMTAATFAGYLVPVVLKKLKIDPALASAVFVTTVTDVCGFFFFLGLGTLFLPYLT
ncbi:magnesium transporter [Clostridium perfringens]|uniref:magnesium transporter n=1 Tax=Clostridium perfringens TaxID=1502 RepID=UPI0013E396A1|nr:magnesium transporter [Clostridium perfringens]MCX0385395.1 magnesium transporter [Clostridium perfringens]MDT7930551.1 magnesium transporter [Clostridium perfringens]MDT7953993.1 magnesium transporter [Clostridium perfringens]NGT54797.1 magnesium transporter [Clostridium perfringens]